MTLQASGEVTRLLLRVIQGSDGPYTYVRSLIYPAFFCFGDDLKDLIRDWLKLKIIEIKPNIPEYYELSRPKFAPP
jgi:hypothetical protein